MYTGHVPDDMSKRFFPFTSLKQLLALTGTFCFAPPKITLQRSLNSVSAVLTDVLQCLKLKKNQKLSLS